jgi:GNAT superfamily N-acetyltransferase
LNITRLEELALNAWPALTTLHMDGWVLRLANGYSRRANSVQALYPGSRPLEEKIRAVEAVYRGRGQPVVFKLTPAAQPMELDESLAALGYALEAPTSVQAVELDERRRTTDDRPFGRGARVETGGLGEALIEGALTDAWVAAYGALSGVAARHTATMRQMLSSLVPVHGFALQCDARGAPLACGLAVVEAGHVGLFDIVTHPAHRREGHARRLLGDLLRWAVERGAHTAYLQVMLNNAPALRLYEALGFEEVYRYWYRFSG